MCIVTVFFNTYQYLSITTNTRCTNNFIRRKLVSTLLSDYHYAIIQEYEYIQKPKTISWKTPHFTLKYVKKYVKCTKGKTNYKNLQFKICVKQHMVQTVLNF